MTNFFDKEPPIGRLFEFMERDRFTITTAFVYLLILGVIRSVSESLYFEYPVFSLYLIIQHTAFNFPVLVLGVLVIKIATGERLRTVYNIILIGFWIVALPAFIDRFIFGLSGYELGHLYSYYATGTPFINKLRFINPSYILLDPNVSPGLRFMLFSLIIFSVVYVSYKVKIFKLPKLIKEKDYRRITNKFSSIFFGAFGVWLVIWFISVIGSSLLRSGEGGTVIVIDLFTQKPYLKYYNFFSQHGYSTAQIYPQSVGITDQVGLAEGLAKQQRSLFMIMFFYFLSVISLSISLYVSSRDYLKRVMKTLNKPIILVTTSSALLGSAVLHHIDADFSSGWALDPTYVFHLPYVFFIFTIGFFMGCFSSFVWSMYREECPLSNWHAKRWAVVSFLGAGSSAFILGPIKTFSLFLITSSLLYLAFRNEEGTLDLYRSLTFSLSSVFLFLVGSYSPGIWKSTIWDLSPQGPVVSSYQIVNVSRSPPLNGTILSYTVILFLTLFVFTVLTKLIQEERVPTDLPKALVIIPAFLIPAIVFNRWDYLVVFLGLGFNCSLFMDKKSPFLPLGLLGLELLYVILRVFEIIKIP